MQPIQLATVILGPIVFFALFSYLIVKNRRSQESWINVCFMLNPRYGLGSQPLFWVAMLTPLTWFAFLGLYIWDDYHVSLDQAGFKEFIRISTLPMLLLSLSVPLTALVAHLHSTAQTAKQIQKNEHEHFYLHRREFVSYFKDIDETEIYGVYSIRYNIAPRTHGRLFIGAPRDGVPELDFKEVDKLIFFLKKAERCLAAVVSESDFKVRNGAYYDFCVTLRPIINFLNIRDLQLLVENDSDFLGHDGKEFKSIGSTGLHSFAAYECVRVYLASVVCFACYPEGVNEMEELSESSKKIQDLRLDADMENRFEEIFFKAKLR